MRQQDGRAYRTGFRLGVAITVYRPPGLIPACTLIAATIRSAPPGLRTSRTRARDAFPTEEMAVATTSTDHDGRATAAGIYDAVLGGTHNTEADRAVAAQLLNLEPELRQMAWANRGFLQRAAAWMARQGVRAFIDIGAGLPTMSNTHDVVHAVDPGSQIIYVDNDANAVAQGRELLTGVRNVEYIQHDLTSDDLLADPTLAALIGAGKPVGLLLVGMLYFVSDQDDALGKVRRLVEALPSGSYVALSHVISDWQSEDVILDGTEVYRTRSTTQLYVRSKAEVAMFLDGLEIVPPYEGAEPALNYVGFWGAEDPVMAHDDASRWFVAAVARRP
jgi:S-adenosyl methyltransferase